MTSDVKARPHAFVTGASSGIGKAFAERLARDGYDLTVTARRGERLEDLAERLRAEPGIKVEVAAADLGKAADLHALEKRIAAIDSLEMLVNNAGFGGYMPFVQLDPDKAEELIRVQVLAVTRLTRAAVPGMIARGKGSIINVSSRLAFSSPVKSEQLPKRATYVGTKAFIVSFSQILQSELEGTGIRVQALCPAVVRTEFHLRMGVDPDRFPPQIVSKPEDVVQASLAALRLGEVICMPGMEDTGLLERLEEDQRQLFDRSGAGALASRYRA
jgi:short-subunit dehydrogenase